MLQKNSVWFWVCFSCINAFWYAFLKENKPSRKCRTKLIKPSSENTFRQMDLCFSFKLIFKWIENLNVYHNIHLCLQMCVHVMKQKKCHYIGNCSFAHSLEERDVWTYMKNNSCENTPNSAIFWFYDLVMSIGRLCVLKRGVYFCAFSVRDMQQMYEMWLSLTNQHRRADSNLMTPPPEEKQIAMPTDCSESMVGGRRGGYV